MVVEIMVNEFVDRGRRIGRFRKHNAHKVRPTAPLKMIWVCVSMSAGLGMLNSALLSFSP